MSTIFEIMSTNNHEQIMFCNDAHSGLKAIIAVHNTQLGPALGGCRMYPYASEADALKDALRLSRGMTYKAAISNLQLGGGKAVIIADPKKHSSELLFRTFGRFVNSLNGKYITAEDAGTSVECMEWVRLETKHVAGIPAYFGGFGDPSIATAHGVFCGIKAAVKKALGKENLKGIKVAVQGAGGHVGYNLCKELHSSGAILYVADIDEEALNKVTNEFNAQAVEADKIYNSPVDVYSPCALGATVNDKTLPMLKCSIIAGAANNQLEDEKKHGPELIKRGILYAPDYVINAGGLINASIEVSCNGLSNSSSACQQYVLAKVEKIYDTLLNIFSIADKENITTQAAANKIAEKKISDINLIKNIYST